MTARNAPCPCGSGKKYKRCCLERDERGPGPDRSEPEVDEAIRRLGDTERLTSLLDWTSFDFGVDPYDILIDDMLAADKDTRAHVFLTASMRHITPAVRLRLRDELDRRAAGIDVRHRGLVQVARRALADLSMSAVLSGLVHELYNQHLIENSSRRVLDAAPVSAIVKRLDRDPDSVLADLRAWDSTRTDAWPLMEVVIDLDPEEFPVPLRPLIDFASRSPGWRSARWLFQALDIAVGADVDRILDALASMPQVAAPTARHIVDVPIHHATTRLDAYELLLRLGDRDLFRQVFDELANPDSFVEPTDEPDRLARMLVELDDRRAVGSTIAAIHRETMSDEVQEAVADAFRANGWWKEVEDGLRALKRGTAELVETGTEQGPFFVRHLEGKVLGATDGPDLDVLRTQDLWNQSWHEELGWMRPCDLFDPGPVERKMMAGMAGLVAGATSAASFKERQARWMVTPGPDGRIPAVAMHQERLAEGRHLWLVAEQAEEQACGLYEEAMASLEAGDRAYARRLLTVAVALMPEHVFAQRALVELKP